MTDIKKKGNGKAKKLQLHKESLKDMTARGPGQVKGGALNQTWGVAGCASNNEYCKRS